MLAADVGGEEGAADGPPRSAAVGKEVALGLLVASGFVHVVESDGEDDDEVYDDGGDVARGKRSGGHKGIDE